MVLASCEGEISKVTFRMEMRGFSLEQSDTFPSGAAKDFTHRLSGGTVIFRNGIDEYKFETGKSRIDEYLFSLPVGDYEVEFFISPASIYGQSQASFISETLAISVDSYTEKVVLDISANCALMLISDTHGHLDNGAHFIERHEINEGYFRAYPLSLDTATGLFYAYFTPDPDPLDPTAFIWLFPLSSDPERIGISTTGFEIGVQYWLNVLE